MIDPGVEIGRLAGVGYRTTCNVGATVESDMTRNQREEVLSIVELLKV